MTSINLSEDVIQQISNLLEEKGYIDGKNLSLSQLEIIPEFIIIASILQSPDKAVRNEDLETKIPTSLAMTLSNLAIDQVIYQSSGDYQWRLVEELLQQLTITPEIVDTPVEETVAETTTDHSVFLTTLKEIGLDFSNSPNELDVLSYLFTHEETSMDELTTGVATSTPLSLTLSNLQADGLIEQTQAYGWKLSKDLSAKLKQNMIISKQIQEIKPNDSKSPYIGINDESNQYLITALQNKGILQTTSENLLDIPEFEILYYIYNHDGVTVAELEKLVSKKDSLALTLSNLNADNIIEQKSNTWVISSSFQRILNAAKSQQKIQKKTEIESQKKLQELQHLNAKQRQLETLATALAKVNAPYVKQVTSPKELLNFSEIEILLVLMQSPGLTTEELESKVFSPNSISLSLSNLQADRLIAQNEYRWELSPQLLNALETSVSPPIKEQQIHVEEVPSIESLNQKEIYSEQLKLRKYFFTQGLIANADISIEELLNKADYELLWIILHNQPIDTDEIQKLMKTESSLSLELSNLAADRLIEYIERESKWRISTHFQTILRKIELDNTEILKEVQANTPLIPVENQSISSTLNSYELEIINILQAKNYQIKKEMGVEATLTPEFLVIKLIHENSPIDALSLEQIVPDNVPLSLTLSNLLSDKIIVESEYKYTLADEYMQLLNNILPEKVEVSVPETSKVVEPTEIPPPTEDLIINTTSEQKNSKDEINEKLMELERQSKLNEERLQSLSPFISATHKLGYIPKVELSLTELLEIPEFYVLLSVYESPGISSTNVKQESLTISPVVISRTINKLNAESYLQIDDDGSLKLNDNFLKLI